MEKRREREKKDMSKYNKKKEKRRERGEKIGDQSRQKTLVREIKKDVHLVELSSVGNELVIPNTKTPGPKRRKNTHAYARMETIR